MRYQDKALEGELQLIQASLQGRWRRQAPPATQDDRDADASLRVRVRVRRHRLDTQLADGVDPLSSAELTLRARQLNQPSVRRVVARGSRRAVNDAHDERLHMLRTSIPVCHEAVSRWSSPLLGLADALEKPGPVNPCGIARALQLLTDGAGPLYHPVAAPSLGRQIWWIADGLQPRQGASPRV